jgi:hypothetical protein
MLCETRITRMTGLTVESPLFDAGAHAIGWPAPSAKERLRLGNTGLLKLVSPAILHLSAALDHQPKAVL